MLSNLKKKKENTYVSFMLDRGMGHLKRMGKDKRSELVLRKLGELNVGFSFAILQNGAEDTCSDLNPQSQQEIK